MAGMKSVKMGLPVVRAPVLSSVIVRIVPARSKASASLMRAPYSAPLPLPTISEVGVASPSAQGQAIIKTAMRQDSARLGAWPNVNHKASVKVAGTKSAVTWSASF